MKSSKINTCLENTNMVLQPLSPVSTEPFLTLSLPLLISHLNGSAPTPKAGGIFSAILLMSCF